MSTPDPVRPSVLIVGAGPVGLTMASELLRHGVTLRLVDVCAEPTHTFEGARHCGTNARDSDGHGRRGPRSNPPGCAELQVGERVIHDPHGALHRRYGAGCECLYVIRPDGYIGFRAVPATWERLSDHLGKIFQ